MEILLDHGQVRGGAMTRRAYIVRQCAAVALMLAFLAAAVLA